MTGSFPIHPKRQQMNDSLCQLIASIDAVSSVNDVAQLKKLERAMDHFFSLPNAALHLDVWFRLFERFPDEDGYEMFWTILHGIERQPDYEPLVVESVRRFPSQFPILMVNRMLNGGQTHVGPVDLLELLRTVATSESCLESARADAIRFIKHQEECAGQSAGASPKRD
jgi:hypothetical protein